MGQERPRPYEWWEGVAQYHVRLSAFNGPRNLLSARLKRSNIGHSRCNNPVSARFLSKSGLYRTESAKSPRKS